MRNVEFKTLSASKLRTYTTCPRQYYYAYGEGVFQDETSATVFGSYVHAVLEGYLKHLLVTRQLQDLKGLFEAASARKNDFGRIPETGELSFFEADVVLNRCAARKIEFNSIFALEKFFSIELKDARGIKLEGRIDRIDIEGSPENGRILHIIDYKTGKRKLSSKELADDIQMKFYVLGSFYMYREKFRNFIFSLYYLADNSQVDITPGDPLQYESEICGYISAIADDRAFDKKIAAHCRYCPARKICKPDLSNIEK